MNENAALVLRVRAAADLSRALAARDTVCRSATGGSPADVVTRLQANRRVLLAARSLIDVHPPVGSK